APSTLPADRGAGQHRADDNPDAGVDRLPVARGFRIRRVGVRRLHRGDCIRAVLQIQPASSGPPRSLAEADGPSISELFPGSTGGNSLPSGHMLRTVIVYGLLAFVINRLSPSPRVRRLAVVGAIAIIALMVFDRLYLDVHWESD